jgi:hypothetical protein
MNMLPDAMWPINFWVGGWVGHAGISVAIWQTYSHEGHIIMNIHGL